MKTTKFHIVLLLVSLVCTFSPVNAQESVFQLMNKSAKDGDRFFKEGSYAHALQRYLEEDASGKGGSRLSWKIAYTYYKLHRYTDALKWASDIDKKLVGNSKDELLAYAGIFAANGLYAQAVDAYNDALKLYPDCEFARKQVWRIKNIHFLYEDSLHYSVTGLAVNSPASEIAPVPYPGGLLFLSDTKGEKLFENADAVTGQVSYKFFSVKVNEGVLGSKKSLYSKQLHSKWQNGPLSFYNDFTKAIVAQSSGRVNKKGRMTLQLYEAERKGSSWKIIKPFPHGDPEYTYTDPYMSPQGDVLYFASDRPGGFGGLDLYRCRLQNGKWLPPENLGSEINTEYDEMTPSVSDGVLYFASQGHPGMGGIDIFKAPVGPDGFGEVVNPGYPLNSERDDFGLAFAATNGIGYFSSNRGAGGSDDIYQVEVDLQTYPVLISGILKYKAFSLLDTARLYAFSHVNMFLVDHARDVVVEEVKTDEEGRFSLTIPYFSRYKIRVVEEDGTETLVSLDIPRRKREDYTHEIVVVKDAFESRDKLSPRQSQSLKN